MPFEIALTPQRRDEELTLSKSGDILTINGEAFDFSGIAEGDTRPRAALACDWLASDVTRAGGAIHLTLILPHGAIAPDETKFPAPWLVTSDGPVDLPPHDEAEIAE